MVFDRFNPVSFGFSDDIGWQKNYIDVLQLASQIKSLRGLLSFRDIKANSPVGF